MRNKTPLYTLLAVVVIATLLGSSSPAHAQSMPDYDRTVGPPYAADMPVDSGTNEPGCQCITYFLNYFGLRKVWLGSGNPMDLDTVNNGMVWMKLQGFQQVSDPTQAQVVILHPALNNVYPGDKIDWVKCTQKTRQLPGLF